MATTKTRQFGLKKNLLSLVGIRTPDAPARSLTTIPPTVSQFPGKHTATTKPKLNRTELCVAILVEMHHCATGKTHYLEAANMKSTSFQQTVEHQQDTETIPREAVRYSYPKEVNKDIAARITLAISNGTILSICCSIKLTITLARLYLSRVLAESS